jgi:hypothetical protein
MIRKNYVVPYHLDHVPILTPVMPHVYILNNHYGHSLSTIKQLAEEARKDFPTLTDDDIQFRTYRNTGYIDGMLGCEFRVPEGCLIPKDYTEAAKLPSY